MYLFNMYVYVLNSDRTFLYILVVEKESNTNENKIRTNAMKHEAMTNEICSATETNNETFTSKAQSSKAKFENLKRCPFTLPGKCMCVHVSYFS